MRSIEQMPRRDIARAIYKSLKGTRYEIDKERAKKLARFHDDPKWIPSLQKMIDGQFDNSSEYADN